MSVRKSPQAALALLAGLRFIETENALSLLDSWASDRRLSRRESCVSFAQRKATMSGNTDFEFQNAGNRRCQSASVMGRIDEVTCKLAAQQFGEIEDSGMPTLANVVEHGAVTAKSQYQYRFTPKHHGADRKAAQWLPSLTLDEEFAVFNMADQNSLADQYGNLGKGDPV